MSPTKYINYAKNFYKKIIQQIIFSPRSDMVFILDHLTPFIKLSFINRDEYTRE